MNEVITFETMPKAMAYLINKVEALEKKLLEKNEVPTTPADKWFNIDELKDYLPDHPAKQTIYGWVSKREIPFHKGGKIKSTLPLPNTKSIIEYNVVFPVSDFPRTTLHPF